MLWLKTALHKHEKRDRSCFNSTGETAASKRAARETQGKIQTDAEQSQSWQQLCKHLSIHVQAWTQTWPSLFVIFTLASPAAINNSFKMTPCEYMDGRFSWQ